MGITLAETKAKGWNALIKELGHAVATKFIYFMNQVKGIIPESGENYSRVLQLKR